MSEPIAGMQEQAPPVDDLAGMEGLADAPDGDGAPPPRPDGETEPELAAEPEAEAAEESEEEGVEEGEAEEGPNWEAEAKKYQAIANRLGSRVEKLQQTVAERLDGIESRLPQGPEEPEEVPPDAEEQPAARAAYEARKTREALERTEKRAQEAAASAKLQADINSALEAANQERDLLVGSAEAPGERPDYDAAATFVGHEIIKSQERIRGSLSDEERAELVAKVPLHVLAMARKAETTPAQWILEHAEKWGYEPPAAEPNGNGAEPKKPSAEKKARQMEKTQSLGAVGSGAKTETKGLQEKLTEILDSKGEGAYGQALDRLKKNTGLDEENLWKGINAGIVTVSDLSVLP